MSSALSARIAVWTFIVLHPLERDWRSPSRGDAHRQGLIAFDEARIHPLGLVHHLNLGEALEDFFPDDLQLQLRKPHADAAVNAETERQMRARPRAIDDEFVRALDRLLVAVARDVPH